MQRNFALLSSLLCLLLALPTLADKPPQRQTVLLDYKPLRGHGAPMVEIRFNDKVTGTFMVDSGADQCYISDTLAKKLGLQSYPAYEDNGMPVMKSIDPYFPIEQFNFVTVNKMQMGPMIFNKWTFLVEDHRDLFKFSEQPFDGLIGESLLSEFAVFLDPTRQQIGFIHPGGLSDAEIQTMGFGDFTRLKLKKVAQSGGQNVGNKGGEYQLEMGLKNGDVSQTETPWLDTGAATTSLSYGVAKGLGLSPVDQSAASTLYGSYGTYLASVPTLTLGTLTLRDVPVEYPGNNENVIPPLLGQDILSYCDVLFDFAKLSVYLKPVLPPLAPDTGAVSSADAIDKDRLRDAAEIPFVGYSKALNLESPDAEDDPPARIDALTKAMGGDAADAARYAALGELYWEQKNPQKSREAYAKAVALDRVVVAAKPTDAVALAQLAEELVGAGQNDEAETEGRRATVLAPTEPKTWIALGKALHVRSLVTLTGRSDTVDISDDLRDYRRLITQLEKNKPSPEAMALAQTLSQQARAAFDKAVAVAPQNPDVYQARADFAQDDGLGIKATLDELAGKEVNLGREMDSDGYAADIEQIALLKPNDVDTLRVTILRDAEITFERNDTGLDDRDEKFFGSLPKPFRQSAQLKIDALAKMAKNPDPLKAAAALESLGIAQSEVLRDDTQAEATLRKAIALDPKRGRALARLVVILTTTERYDDIVTLLNALIAQRDTPLARLLLARTQAKQGQFDLAQTQVLAALKLRPDDCVTNLAEAALLLHSSGTNPAALDQAGDCLLKAQQRVGSAANRAQSAQIAVLTSIYQGLTGDVSDAKDGVLQVLATERTNTDARNVLAALVL